MNRYLGSSEMFYWLLEQASPLNVQVILHIRGQITTDALKKTLTLVQEMQPLLRVSIGTNNNQKVKFSSCDQKIPLEILDLDQENKSCSDFAKQELEKSTLVEGMPLMRVLWLRQTNEHYMVLTVSHIITGGVELGYLASGLVRVCDDVMNNHEPSITHFPNRPQVEKLLPTLKSIEIEKQTNQQENIADNVTANHEFANDQTIKRTAFNNFQISKKESTNLFQLAKTNNTTVHAIVCALASRALEIYLSKEYPDQQMHSIMCMSPLNLRPYLTVKMEKNELGSYITGAPISLNNPSQMPVLLLAKHIKQEITRFIKEEKYIEEARNKKNIINHYDTPQKITRFFKQNSFPQVIVTNLGVVPLPADLISIDYTNFNIFGSLGAMLDCPYAMALIVYSFRNCLCFTISYIESTISMQQAEEFKKIIVEQISGLIDAEKINFGE